MQLTGAERRLAGMLFDQIMPAGANARFKLSASEAGVVEFFEGHLDHLPARTRWALRGAIVALGTYVGTAARLRKDGATRAIDFLANSHTYALRESVTLIKSLVAMGYFTNPIVRRELGLDLPPLVQS